MSGTFLLLAATLLLVLYLIYTWVRVTRILQGEKKLRQDTRPYRRILSIGSQNIVVLGDSTAAGTGSSTPEGSIAGRLGELYPNTNVYDFGVVGLKLKGLSAQMSALEKSGQIPHADLVLLQIGANDITHHTPLRLVESGLQEVLAKAKKISTTVLVLHSPPVGNAPLFPAWFRLILNHRTNQVRKVYMEVCKAMDAKYVDLVDAPVSAIFASEPKKYYASDMFHPSAEGYGVWFEEIKKVL